MDFDRVADYELLLGTDHKYYIERKAGALAEILGRHLGKKKGLKILDLGCGTGEAEAILKNIGVIGADSSKKMIKRAKQKRLKSRFLVGDAIDAPFREGTFDAVFSFSLLHHILPEDRKKYYASGERLLKPGGILVIAEHNPLNPVTRYKVWRCPIDRGARLLGAGEIRKDAEKSRLQLAEKINMLFFPPALGKKLFRLERLLEEIPLGGQYIVVLLKGGRGRGK